MGHRLNSGLGGGVRRHVGVCEGGRGGAEVDHRGGVAVAQSGNGLAGHQEGADEVDPQHLLEVGERGIDEMGGPQDPCHVDEGVQAAEPLDRVGHTVFHGLLVADVHLDRGEPVGVRSGFGGGVLQAGLADVGGDHPTAFVQDAQHRRLPDAGTPTGDQYASVGVSLKRRHGQILPCGARHVSALSHCVGTGRGLDVPAASGSDAG